MRRLGQVLRVEAMSLYKHVANKDDILDGIADLVMGDFEVPSGDVDWKTAIRRSAISAHQVLLGHPWASSLIESRLNAGPARLRYLDAVIGVLAAAGFPMPIVIRAIMALDSHTYGFVLQELAWPFDDRERSGDGGDLRARSSRGRVPEPPRDGRDGGDGPGRRPGRLRVRTGPDPRRPRAAPGHRRTVTLIGVVRHPTMSKRLAVAGLTSA